MKKSADDLGLVFAVWNGAGPPPADDFAQRVLATVATDVHAETAASEPSLSSPRAIGKGRFRTTPWLVGLALALPAAAALALLVGRRFAREAQGTATTSAHRETIAIGGRGRAVLEPEATLTWSVLANNDAEINQSAGRVFYRVEPGGSFTVRTPLGTAVALGTCFGVEVKMADKPNRQQWMAGATGAALATVVLVTVYEGKVLVAGGSGKTALVAGERATLDGVRGPQRDEGEPTAGAPPGAGQGTASDPAATTAQRAADGLSLEELKAKYQVQSRELERLQAAAAGAHQPAPEGERERETFVDPSHEELVARAKRCGLAWDAPPVDIEAPQVDDRWGLTPGEKEVVTPILAKFNEHELRAMRDLYVEVTGAKDVAERLSPSALVSEIREKAPREDMQQAFRQVSGELAGLLPRAVADHSTPVERLTRLQVTAGDRFERAVAAELGPARAREVRKKDGGWTSRFGQNVGCPKGGQADPTPGP